MTSFAQVLKKMTEYSNNYLDWTRVGILFREGTHRYTPEELWNRGIIVVTTATTGLLSHYFNKQEEYCSKNVSAALGILSGLVISHAYVMRELLNKRNNLRVESLKLIGEIEQELNRLEDDGSDNLNDLKMYVSSLVEAIANLTAATETKANATLTLGTRRSLFKELHNQIKDKTFEEIESFLKDKDTNKFTSFKDMIKKLDDGRRQEPVSVVTQSLLNTQKADSTTALSSNLSSRRTMKQT